MRLLVTGGAGFIGSHFIRYWLEAHAQDSIVNVDLLTYAGNEQNLQDVVERFCERYVFIRGNIVNTTLMRRIFAEHKPDVVVHLAAESHNSWALVSPGKFFRTNVLGTQIVLEAARKRGVARFQHVSTCEVYGDLPLDSREAFTEESPLRPRTPYSASKAGADHLAQAYFHTYGTPIVISRCANNYGSHQFPEKIIPLFTTRALNGRVLPLYAHSQNRREWVHVLDHCRAIDLMIQHGKAGEIYNVGTGEEKTVEEIANAVLDALNLPPSLKRYVPDRPGHDRRYLLDSTKARTELGWAPTHRFDDGLRETVRWYVEHRQWWQPLYDRNSLKEEAWPNPKP